MRILLTRAEVREIAKESSKLLRQIGSKRRQRAVQQAKMNSRLEKVRQQYQPAIDELEREEETLKAELRQLVVPHYFELIASRTKGTIKLASGVINLRTTDVSVTDLIKEVGGDEIVMKRIERARGVRKYIVTKREINKQALKANPSFMEKIGLLPRKKSRLVIKPNNYQGEEIILATDPLVMPFSTEGD